MFTNTNRNEGCSDDEDEDKIKEESKKAVLTQFRNSKLYKYFINRMNQLNTLGNWFFKLAENVYVIEIIKFENIKICEYDRLSNLKRH